ncbi:PREDICTED: uncharacterized protein LOC105152753 [Acromyrmex echinatior]|uniref:uncharacterized protein LOC105152753 n=1 Tax=Acromyrmex echinatior TaxID=103372 RepID=UPI000581028B|nr:PREDICTED: uncharacterized protein LOC105152753 [Acromyrmex echinatior]
MPEHVYSDNGTNFVGANNQLKEIYILLNSKEHNAVMSKSARVVSCGTLSHQQFHILVDYGRPHLFTFEELNIFTIEVEGILNSRPIISLSSDPNDMLVLTPSHYLIGKPSTTLPEGDLSSVPANRLSTWQYYKGATRLLGMLESRILKRTPNEN